MTAIFVVALGIIAFFVVWRLMKPGVDDSAGAPTENFVAPEVRETERRAAHEARFRPYTPPPPQTPTVLHAPAPDPPADLAGLRAFARVADNVGVLDISPDGREAMALHDDASITVYDVASGAPIQTWRDVCPAQWIREMDSSSCFSCAARRLFLGWNVDAGSENVVIDLSGRKVARVYAAEDGQDSMQTGAMSADGRFVAGHVTYGKSHPAFDLDHVEAYDDEENYGGFGDYPLAFGNLWPATAIARDGRWFAYDQGDGDVYVMERDDEPEGLDPFPQWGWPGYDLHMSVSGDDTPDLLDFDDAGERLLVVENDGGLVVADLAAKDFRLLKPFAASGPQAEAVGESVPDGFRCTGARWVNGRRQAILDIVRPEPAFVLVDLDDGGIVRTWPAAVETVEQAIVSRTGGFALIPGDGGAIRVLPLLDDA